MALEQFRNGERIAFMQLDPNSSFNLNTYLANFGVPGAGTENEGSESLLEVTPQGGFIGVADRVTTGAPQMSTNIIMVQMGDNMYYYSPIDTDMYDDEGHLLVHIPAGWNQAGGETGTDFTPVTTLQTVELSSGNSVTSMSAKFASLNGTVFGAVLTDTPLTQFGGGLTIEGIDFGNVSNGDTNSDLANLLLGYEGNDGSFVSFANGMALQGGSTDGKGLLYLWLGEDSEPIVFYATATIEGLVETVGYQNLTDGKYTFSESTTVGTVGTDFSDWNGTLIGALAGGSPTPTPTDTVTAGTYSTATGIWTDNADYELTDDGAGTYAVTGLIPYGRADSLFDFAGYRFAVKISRDTITSRNDLPSGNIVVITVGTEVSQYTKDAFETDGSLIYIAAPTAETLTTPRVVKIAWSMAGDTLQESDFTSYTFDLSNAELAPIPQEDEEESRVAYCITPKITSDKFVKVVAPNGGLRAGQVVNCVALASSVEGVPLNLEVYSPSLPTTATLGSRFYALIVNGGFENLADGRRPSGNPDYTTYVYNEGDVCQGILLDKNLVFEISGSCISGDTSIDPSADIGRYIVPTNGTYVLSIANAPTDGGCLKIIGTRYFYRGGIFGKNFIPTYICLAVN